MRSKPNHLTVDLSAVSHLDTSGLATLFEAARIAREQSTRLVLTGLQGQPRQLLEIPQFAGLFGVLPEEPFIFLDLPQILEEHLDQV